MRYTIIETLVRLAYALAPESDVKTSLGDALYAIEYRAEWGEVLEREE